MHWADLLAGAAGIEPANHGIKTRGIYAVTRWYCKVWENEKSILYILLYIFVVFILENRSSLLSRLSIEMGVPFSTRRVLMPYVPPNLQKTLARHSQIRTASISQVIDTKVFNFSTLQGIVPCLFWIGWKYKVSMTRSHLLFLAVSLTVKN